MIDDNTVFDKTDMRNGVPRLAPDARKGNQKFVDLLQRSQRKKTPRRPRLRSLGFWRKSRGSFRSRALRNDLAWMKILQQLARTHC
jgi:hypothetical protein